MSAAAIGVDVGGTRARLLVVDADGSPVSGEAHEVAWCAGGATPTPELLATVIAQLAAEAGCRIAPGMLVGVGFAGQLSRDGRIVRNAPNLGWRDVALADELADALQLPREAVTVVNDLKAILRGELAVGAARGVDNVLAVYAGTGVGGAIAVEGRVVYGAGGNAGEIGHVKLPGSSAICGCGEVGCIEATAGGAALLRRFAAASASGELSHLGVSPTIVDVDRAAALGDSAALAHLDEVAEVLSFAIANACTLLNPELLLLGGGVVDHAPLLRAKIVSRTTILTLAVARTTLRVAGGQLGAKAGAIGAASAAIDARRARVSVARH